MSEENTQQSEEPVDAPETEATTKNLDDVYKEFNVDDAAQQFNAQPVPTQNAPQIPQQPYVPDPLNEAEAFRNLQASQLQEAQYLRGNLTQLQQQLNQMQQAQAKREIESDIGKAVEHINKKVNVNPKAIDVMLNAKAEEDPRFKSLWDNRNKKPKAWQAALDAYSNEIADTFKVRQDPQLTENQRAMKAAQQSMATTKTENPNEKWEGLNGPQFDQEWDRLIRG